MRRVWISVVLACCLPSSASAHPVPFSYVDARIQQGAIELTVVAHIFDLGNDLNVQPPERLLQPDVFAAQSQPVVRLLGDRLHLAADAVPLAAASWSTPEALPERQSIRVRARYALGGPLGRLDVTTLMFPYDPQHKTFLNVFENGEIAAQAILDKNKTTFQYFMGTTEGTRAVLKRFFQAGAWQMLSGPGPLIFLTGLLLLGGTMPQLLTIVAAFAVAHCLTLSLAALGFVIPPANAIEPAVALSAVYIGADNLLVRAGGRDTRVWVAFGFGLIHGFGFANALRAMDLPNRALGWAVFSFNIGVEIGQVALVALVALLFAWIRSQSEGAARRLAVAGSAVVILAGAVWFVERVFFSGGTA